MNHLLSLPDWVPFFHWHQAWISALVMFCMDFGMLAVCWWVLELTYWRQYFWSNVIGDSFFLPLTAYIETQLLHHLPQRPIHAWYTSTWWYVGVFVVGVIIIAGVTFNEVRTDQFNKAQELSPSKLWHTVAWPAFFWFLVAPAPAALSATSSQTARLFALALLGAGGWAWMLALDWKRSPPPLGGVVQFDYRGWYEDYNPVSFRTDQWRAAHRPFPEWFREKYHLTGAPKRYYYRH